MTPAHSSLSRSIRAFLSPGLSFGFFGFLCLFGLFGITACGGGPDVATSTGTILYVGTGSGIYAFSLQSNNVLKPVSTSPVVSGNVYSLQYVQTPGGSGTPPVLYAATGGSSIATYTVTGGGALSSSGTLAPSSCLHNYSGVTATPDGNWLLAVDGTTQSPAVNIAAINLKTKNCYTTSASTSTYPISIAVDCLVGPSTCDILVTISTSVISSAVSTNPEYFQGWSTSTPGTFSTPSTLTKLGNVWGNAFSPATTYFYLSVPSPGEVGSLPGGSSVTTASTYTATATGLPGTITSPCVDQKNNQIYLPTSNGSIYQISINTTGGIGSPNQIWNANSSSNLIPASPFMSACTIQN